MKAASARARSEQTLVEECMRWAVNRMHGQVLRPGMRLPSIRALATARGISPFTVAEAYSRLVASGYLESRRGSGFYVLRREPAPRVAGDANPTIDLKWLLRHMLESAAAAGPGLGVLPTAWLDGAQVATALRSLGRQGTGRWLDSGTREGFEPLREVLQQRLAARDIIARADEIVLTTGITHALNLVLRVLIAPGDTVLGVDPRTVRASSACRAAPKGRISSVWNVSSSRSGRACSSPVPPRTIRPGFR
jgi:DNA-binding transcriptional MocR family regulator